MQMGDMKGARRDTQTGLSTRTNRRCHSVKEMALRAAYWWVLLTLERCYDALDTDPVLGRHEQHVVMQLVLVQD